MFSDIHLEEKNYTIQKDQNEEDYKQIQLVENMSQPELDTLVSRIQTRFNKSLISVTQNYKLTIFSNLDNQQTHLLNQFEQKSNILQWLQIKLSELPQLAKNDPGLQELVNNSRQMITVGCESQKSYLSALIDQFSREFEIEQEQELTQQNFLNSFKFEQNDPTPPRQDKDFRINDLLPKITCYECQQCNFDIISFRRHLRQDHQTVFMGFKCIECEFEVDGYEEFGNHIVRIHGGKSCPCERTFKSKQLLFEHLRSCMKFYLRSDEPLQKVKPKSKKKNHLLSR